MNLIEIVVEGCGGRRATGDLCGVSIEAVRKWIDQGRLPRTEHTGETDHAARIVARLRERGVESVTGPDGVTVEALRNFGYPKADKIAA